MLSDENKPLALSIHDNIDKYYGEIRRNLQGRYRSWEHCFGFFRRITPAGITAQRHEAALQLAFYLASWGMYRGSSFLLKYDYTLHLPVIDCLAESSFRRLWEEDVGSVDADDNLVQLILDTVEGVRHSYKKFGEATDTLVTKIILGTIGCLPACDRFFKDGFSCAGFQYSYLNRNFVSRIIQFCRKNFQELQNEQQNINAIGGLHYPLMKLADMYFWQIGFNRWQEGRDPKTIEIPTD